MKKIMTIIVVAVVLLGGFFYLRYQVYFSRGKNKTEEIFIINKGEKSAEIASRLENDGLISHAWYFYIYLHTHNMADKILPGKYELSGNMTIPEVVLTITSEQENFATITFPEGWTSKKMADRLTANGFDGSEFLQIVNNPPQDIKSRYSYLNDVHTLEGYLFPDTYYFPKDATAEDIVLRMIDNFNIRLNAQMRSDIAKQDKSINDVIIMASIIEMEVRTSQDRSMVSGILWNRLADGQALQCDSTLGYILDTSKVKYSLQDIETASPYNTYLNKGLPPGPISNPGLDSINAAIHPTDSDYNYFLNDPKTGQTVYATSYAQQEANKVRYGL